MTKRTVLMSVCACAAVLACGPANAAWTSDATGLSDACESPGSERAELRAQLESHYLPAASQLAREITLEIIGREGGWPAASGAASSLRSQSSPMAAIGRPLSEPAPVDESAGKRRHKVLTIILSPIQEGLRKLSSLIGIRK